MENVDLGPAARRLAELVTSVGDLIQHVGGLTLAFTAAAAKAGGAHAEQQASGDASRLPQDWRTRIPRDLDALAQAWREPGAWAGTTRIAGMDSPAAMTGLAVADELVVHGWDIARAAGQPYYAEPDLLQA